MPRISMGPALPTGIPSKESFFDVTLYEFERPAELLSRLNIYSVHGLSFTNTALIPLSFSSLNALISHSLYSFLLNDNAFQEYFCTSSINELTKKHQQHWNWFRQQKPFLIQKKTGKQADLLEHTESIKINPHDNTFYLLLKLGKESQINITSFLNNVYSDCELP